MNRPLRIPHSRCALALALLALAFARDAAAQQDAADLVIRGNLDDAPRPHADAVRAPGPIQMDGRLDEAAWKAAPVIDRFVQQKPRAGAPATERTELRILYDDQFLYVGVELYYADPSQIVRTGLQRDANTAEGDVFGISFDTFLDRQNVTAFFVNPGGAIRDAQSSEDGRIKNFAWDGAARAKTRTTDHGWAAELAIPWSSLRFDGAREKQVWGMNFMRRIRHNNEEVSWSPMDRFASIYTASKSGTFTGLDGIRPGRNLSLKPYVVETRSSGSLRESTERDFDAGADVKYGITSGVTLDLTYNTDFSQVEADRPQVNLTRFSLFFPERREFFLENQSLFRFGDLPMQGSRSGATERDFTLFHTRRIGLTARGAPLPVLGGARVSGTAGPVSIGLLDMQTRASGGTPAENFGVARVRAAVTNGLNAGAIFVNRAATEGPEAHNRSFGLDADFSAHKNYLLVQTYLAGAQGRNADGTPVERDWAGRASVSWKDPFWEAGALFRQLGEDFTPGTGFVSRRGIRHEFLTLGVTPRVARGPILELNPYLSMQRYSLLAGGLETRQLEGGMGSEFRDGSTAGLTFTDRLETVRTAFAVGGARVAPGEYRFREAAASYGTNRGRPLSASVSVGGGGYYGGDRRSISGGVLGRVGDRAIIDVSAETNRIELPGQVRASASAYTANLDYFFSTSVVTSGLLQYDQTAGELVADVRLRWIHAPLSDLYLVLTERRDTRADVLLERLITLKVTRLVQF
jgi:hypothetical protein